MEAESRGLRIPHDLAVIGFGDLDFAASNRPSITTVSVDRRAIGQRALRCWPIVLNRNRAQKLLWILAFI